MSHLLWPRASNTAALLTCLFLLACAEAPRPGMMTPAVSQAASPAVAKTLRVDPVTGGTPTESWNKPRLGDPEFRQALVEAMARSGLVRGVVTDGPADWTLRAVIVSQAMEGTWRTSEDLMVRYDLAGPTGPPLWGETVVTHHELGVSDIFYGQERMRVLIETTARDNIAQMLSHFGSWLRTAP